MAIHDPSRALAHIARIAHQGGLVGLSQDEALGLIRRLTVPYWDKSGVGAKERVQAACVAARKEGGNG